MNLAEKLRLDNKDTKVFVCERTREKDLTMFVSNLQLEIFLLEILNHMFTILRLHIFHCFQSFPHTGVKFSALEIMTADLTT